MKCRILRDFVASFHLNFMKLTIKSNSALHTPFHCQTSALHHQLHIKTSLWRTNHLCCSFHWMFRNQYCLSPLIKVQYTFKSTLIFQNIWVISCFYGFKPQVVPFKIFLDCLLWNRSECLFLNPVLSPPKGFLHVYEYTLY